MPTSDVPSQVAVKSYSPSAGTTNWYTAHGTPAPHPANPGLLGLSTTPEVTPSPGVGIVGAVPGSPVPANGVTVAPASTVPPATGRSIAKPPTVTPETPIAPAAPGASTKLMLEAPAVAGCVTTGVPDSVT